MVNQYEQRRHECVPVTGGRWHCRACGHLVGTLEDAIRHVVAWQPDFRPLWTRQ